MVVAPSDDPTVSSYGYSSSNTSDDEDGTVVNPPLPQGITWPRHWTLDERAAHIEMILNRKKEWLVDTLLQSVFRHFDQNNMVRCFENGILNRLHQEGMSDEFWDRSKKEIGEDIIKGAMSAVEAFAATRHLSIVMAHQLSASFKMCYMQALVIEDILDDDNQAAWMAYD